MVSLIKSDDKQTRRRLASVCLVHHQGFERRGEGSETLKTGGLTALPDLTYPRTYPDHTNYNVM